MREKKKKSKNGKYDIRIKEVLGNKRRINEKDFRFIGKLLFYLL
jgi:hypothetical protein